MAHSIGILFLSQSSHCKGMPSCSVFETKNPVCVVDSLEGFCVFPGRDGPAI